MTAYLLDSDVIIEFLRGNKTTISLIHELADDGIGCSVLTSMEVKRGLFSKQEKEAIYFFRAMKIYSVIPKIGDLAVDFIKEWRSKGKTLQLIDTAIVATAVTNNLTLVTYNKRDYPMKELRMI